MRAVGSYMRWRPLKPNLANFRAERRIVDDWRDVEPIEMAQICTPNFYNILEVSIFNK